MCCNRFNNDYTDKHITKQEQSHKIKYNKYYDFFKIIFIQMKTPIISWLQNDVSRGFSVDQLKLSLTFQPDALLVWAKH